MNQILSYFCDCSGTGTGNESKCCGEFEEAELKIAKVKSHETKADRQREGNPETETATDTEIQMEMELSELKHRLSEKSGCQGEELDRCISLISRSTSFFGSEGEWNYHICPFRENAGFEGLISFLTTRIGGNPHDKGLISATGSTTVSAARNVADLQSDSCFCSNDQPNQWLCYDFKDLRVGVTHYIIRSQGGKSGVNHLRSWVIEGSEDNSNWMELDRRENDSGLNGPSLVCSFEVRNVIESRFIRIRSTGPTWYGQHYMYFKAFEVFGGLRVPKSLKFA
jgi:hypothetical protein